MTGKWSFKIKSSNFDEGDAQNASPVSTNFAKKGRSATKQGFIERKTIRMEVGMFLPVNLFPCIIFEINELSYWYSTTTSVFSFSTKRWI